jgi:hypothetical protein
MEGDDYKAEFTKAFAPDSKPWQRDMLDTLLEDEPARRHVRATRFLSSPKPVYVGYDPDTTGFVYRDQKGMFLRARRTPKLKNGGVGPTLDVNIPCIDMLLPTKTAIAAARVAGAADPALLLVFQDELGNRLHRFMNIQY